MESQNLKAPIVLIERLTLLTLPLALGLSWRYRGSYFIHASWAFQSKWLQRLLRMLGNVRPLRFENIPGSNFEVQSRATAGMSDDFYDMCRVMEHDISLSFL